MNDEKINTKIKYINKGQTRAHNTIIEVIPAYITDQMLN